MKVFLRNTKTGLYCTGSDGWVATEQQALDFTTVPQATRFALDEPSPETEIVLRSDLLPDEVVVPVIPEWCGIECLHAESHRIDAVRARAAELGADA